MNQNNIASKLRLAREAIGLTQEKAAHSIGLPRTAITKMESGERPISTLELTNLARLYHRSISYFFNDEVGDDLLVELYRVAPGLNKTPEVRKHVDMCIDLCRQGIVLERILGNRVGTYLPSYNYIVPKSAQEAIKQGENIAKQERSRLGLGSSPVGDIAELISNQNIWTSSANFPDSMSGLFIHHDSIGLAIFVNDSHVRNRKRFSYAHEYAHALFDRNRDQAITVSSRENTSDMIEKRANAFAAEFLIPEEGVRDLLKIMNKGGPTREEKILYDPSSEEVTQVHLRSDGKSQKITYQDLAYIAHHFGVSYQGAAYRLKNLSLISNQECSSLIGQEGAGKSYISLLYSHQDLESTIDDNRELRNHILKLTIEAYRQELISRGKLSDLSKLIDIPSDTVLELAETA